MTSIKQHLEENNMTYYQHLKFAVFLGFVCVLAGMCLIIHAILPCFFQTAGGDLVQALAIVLKKRRLTTDT